MSEPIIYFFNLTSRSSIGVSHEQQWWHWHQYRRIRLLKKKKKSHEKAERGTHKWIFYSKKFGQPKISWEKLGSDISELPESESELSFLQKKIRFSLYAIWWFWLSSTVREPISCGMGTEVHWLLPDFFLLGESLEERIVLSTSTEVYVVCRKNQRKG